MFVSQKHAETWRLFVGCSWAKKISEKGLDGSLYPYSSEPRRYESSFLMVYGEDWV